MQYVPECCLRLVGHIEWQDTIYDWNIETFVSLNCKECRSTRLLHIIAFHEIFHQSPSFIRTIVKMSEIKRAASEKCKKNEWKLKNIHFSFLKSYI